MKLTERMTGEREDRLRVFIGGREYYWPRAREIRLEALLEGLSTAYLLCDHFYPPGSHLRPTLGGAEYQLVRVFSDELWSYQGGGMARSIFAHVLEACGFANFSAIGKFFVVNDGWDGEIFRRNAERLLSDRPIESKPRPSSSSIQCPYKAGTQQPLKAFLPFVGRDKVVLCLEKSGLKTLDDLRSTLGAEGGIQRVLDLLSVNGRQISLPFSFFNQLLLFLGLGRDRSAFSRGNYGHRDKNSLSVIPSLSNRSDFVHRLHQDGIETVPKLLEVLATGEDGEQRIKRILWGPKTGNRHGEAVISECRELLASRGVVK